MRGAAHAADKGGRSRQRRCFQQIIDSDQQERERRYTAASQIRAFQQFIDRFWRATTAILNAAVGLHNAPKALSRWIAWPRVLGCVRAIIPVQAGNTPSIPLRNTVVPFLSSTGGSDISVTQFVNDGNGIYDIRIVPFVRNPACAWLSGEYIYAVQIRATRKAAVLQGGALAKLTIL